MPGVAPIGNIPGQIPVTPPNREEEAAQVRRAPEAEEEQAVRPPEEEEEVAQVQEREQAPPVEGLGNNIDLTA
jgi:septal ring factor EnvC (AmiA/AmiB activator)